MYKKINSYFLIFIILFSLVPVKADAPIKYYEIDSDIELRGAIFVDVDPTGFYASLNNGVIQIDSSINYNDVSIKFKGTALNSRLKKYNGFNVGYTHISHDGIITNELKSLEIDYQGFAYLNTDFSTVIINGMTGITTTTLTGLPGNQSISIPNGSSYNLNITNNHAGVFESIDGKTYQNKTLITINNSMITNETQIPIQLFINLKGVVNSGDIGVGFNNESGIIQAIPRQIEYIWDSDNVSIYLPYNTISGIDNEFVILHGADNTTEPLSDSTYGSETVWDSDTLAAYLMNDGTTMTDSTSNNRHGTKYGTSSSIDGEYGKGINFDGSSAYYTLPSTVGTDLTGAIILRTNPDLVATTNYLFTDSQDSGNTQQIYFGGDGLQSGLYDNSAWQYSFSQFAATNVYYTFITTHRDSDANFIYNGITDFDNSVNSDTYTHNNIRLGGYTSATTQLYDGQVYHLRIIDENKNNDYLLTTYNNLNNPTAIGINPFYLSIGELQQAYGVINITASITGDNNTQSYNTSESKEFSLIPTGTTNNVLINTTSIDYDITIITYWTDDTTQYNQTSDFGYVKSYINYTSEFNINTVIFNDTINLGIHNFSNDDYIGLINVTINDSYIIGIRNNQEINATAYNLIKDIEYLINFTIPYNNIFTLSNQSDTTAYLGVSKQFNDSNYNDPDNNPISSRFWNFGDSDTSNISNPIHIYNSLGIFNANYTVTENATTNSQTITKEFNVTVEVQPVQNLTSILEQSYINFSWSDYLSADYWNVSELEESIPYLNISIVLDGIKDSTYDCCAQGIVMYSPNPQSNTNYELILLFRNSTHLIGYAEGWDDDNLNNDDYFLIGIDGENNNLTVNDRKFILNEGGSTDAKRYDEISGSWIPTSTDSIGVVSGGGVAGQISYEMIVPISEIIGFVDNATIKFYMERECSYLNPTVETFYPLNLINSTDATIWKSVILTDGEVYNYIGNTSISEFNSTGLDIFSWNKHQFITINDTTESSPAYSIDITADIQHFTVSGYTKDTLGNIVGGVTVHATNGHVMEATQSDINGYYEGVNFHTGNYTIYGNKSGYAENFTNVYVIENTSNINVTLTAYTITDWEIYHQLLLIQSQNDKILLNMSINNTIINDKIDTILIFILLNMAVIVGIIIGKRGKNNDN